MKSKTNTAEAAPAQSGRHFWQQEQKAGTLQGAVLSNPTAAVRDLGPIATILAGCGVAEATPASSHTELAQFMVEVAHLRRQNFNLLRVLEAVMATSATPLGQAKAERFHQACQEARAAINQAEGRAAEC